MARNFYFGSDAAMVAGSALFNAGISADASALGLTEAQVLRYGEVNAALQSAYQAATTPATRTVVAVSGKNEAVRSMQRCAKMLSEIIRSTPTVSDAQLMALGLLPRSRRRRRNAPEAAPGVRVVSVIGRVVTLRVSDPGSPSSRCKATNAWGAQVFSHVGDEPPTDARAYRLHCTTSSTKAQIVFSNDVPSGATVWLSAQWVTARGETSPASTPLSFTLQGGAITPIMPGPMRVAA